MYVRDNATLPVSRLPGLVHTTLAGSDDGLRSLSVWSQTIDARGATPPHRHDCEEVVVVTSGRGELHIEGSVQAFGANTTLLIPRNVDHQIFNTGDEPMTLVAAFAATPVEVVLPDGQPLPLPWRS